MKRRDLSFDWKGFAFFLKAAAVLITLGTSAFYGVAYALPYVAETNPAKLVSVEVQAAHATTALPEEPQPVSQRVIQSLTIADAVPQTGKFIAANLVDMKLYLYQDGVMVSEYPIKTKGKPGTPWETPSGFYSIMTKEESHFSTIGKVFMPYSMQFYGNYFIHGWTYYPDGSPTAASFSGGCIKLSTEDAKEVFAFVELGTRIFVYDAKDEAALPPLAVAPLAKPIVDAGSYLIADLDTGHVYAERNASERRPIASVTKLMTALVANEIISLERKVPVPEGALFNPPIATSTDPKVFLVNDLFYPLLMQSSNGVAKALAQYYGEKGFIGWMNATAQGLDMTSTTFADASGISPDNISTTDDLFRLAAYLAHKKSFVFKITDAETKTITSDDGVVYKVSNVNAPAFEDPFVGGKAGQTTAAQETMVSVLSVPLDGITRNIAIIVLGSADQIHDTKSLADWITGAVAYASYQAACVSCAEEPPRQIDL